MKLRNLAYLRSVLFLTLLLAVLYKPELHVRAAFALLPLGLYALFHLTLSWLTWKQRIPPDWTLYAALFDVPVIALVIYAIAGVDLNLYIAFFVAIIGGLLMENAVFGFLIALAACAFYGITIAMTPGAFSQAENLLAFALLIVSSFFLTCLSTMVRAKMRGLEQRRQQRLLWDERLREGRRILAEVQNRLKDPLEHVASVAASLQDQGKSGEIKWEIEAIAGQLKRMGRLFDLDKEEKIPLELEAPLERAVFKLQDALKTGGFDVDVQTLPPAVVRGTKEHLAEFFCAVIEDLLRVLPKGGTVVISGALRSVQWWERGEGVKAWLSLQVEGRGGQGEPVAQAAPTGYDVAAAEWILISHGGRMLEKPGQKARRYRLLLPVCEAPKGQPKFAAA
jgi:hypothetical protein